MLGSEIRRLREDRRLTQAQLAARAGVSRQLVGAVEAGRHLPRVDAAAGLADALGTSVEALLRPAAARAPARGVVADPPEGALVRVGRVGERLVCADAVGDGEGWADADAVVRDGAVELLDRERPAAVVAGCEPALGLAGRLVEGDAGPRVVAVAASTAAAIDALAGGRAHAIAVHGPEGGLPRPPQGVGRWRLARWQVGLAADAERSDAWVEAALGGRVPVVQREAGAGSQAAFERARLGPGPVPGPRAGGHLESAWRAAADGLVAVTIEPSATALGLAFHPLETHASELWVATAHRGLPAVEAYLDELTGRRLRRRLDAIGGYDLADWGSEVPA
ncbi:MAG: helix-turn-helix transcriptional regulator [Egibacteraceae bacterium]